MFEMHARQHFSERHGAERRVQQMPRAAEADKTLSTEGDNGLMRGRFVGLQDPAALARDEEEKNSLHNMLLLMVDEPLVIVVKLADRLHNMRTAYALAPNKRCAVATETLEVWCTLAERLGMFAIKVGPSRVASHPIVPSASVT